MERLYSYIYLILALGFCLETNAQTEKADTLLKTETPSRMVITESPEGTRITVTGYGEEGYEASVLSEYPSESSVSSRQMTLGGGMLGLIADKDERCGSGSNWEAVVDGICIGLDKATGLGNCRGMQWSKSFEIGWLNCIGVAYSFGPSSVSLGVGFDWRNYKTTFSDRCLVVTPEKGIDWGSVKEGDNVRFSRLKIFSLQLPLLYRLRIPKTSLNLKVGPIFNFNTYGSLKTSYYDSNGNKWEDFTKDINQRIFTVDFFGSLSLCNAVGIYVRYSPMKVMNASDGLNFRPLTIGVGFGI